MELIENYNKALQDIFSHTGFKQNGNKFIIDNRTDLYWVIRSKKIVYSAWKQDGEIISADIKYHKIYRGEKLTIFYYISDDKYHTEIVAIYDNEKEGKYNNEPSL